MNTRVLLSDPTGSVRDYASPKDFRRFIRGVTAGMSKFGLDLGRYILDFTQRHYKYVASSGEIVQIRQVMRVFSADM